MAETQEIEIAAVCEGVRIPQSDYLNDRRILRMNESRYEEEEIKGALAVVKKEDRVLELGAGLGVVGAVTAFNCKPQAVLSYEANPNLIPTIEQLYEANGLKDRITVRNRILWAGPDRPKEVSFFIGNSYLGSSLSHHERRRNTEVKVKTDDFAKVAREFKPTVLLIDIEGAELDMLRHADLSGVRAVVVEFHPNIYERQGMRECKSILTKAGFTKVDDVSTRTVWTCTRDQ